MHASVSNLPNYHRDKLLVCTSLCCVVLFVHHYVVPIWIFRICFLFFKSVFESASTQTMTGTGVPVVFELGLPVRSDVVHSLFGDDTDVDVVA